MKKLFLSVFISVLMGTSCCGDPPLEIKTVTDVDKYLQTNWYVEQTLNDDFHSLLPLSIPANCKNVDYYYNYRCIGFGDPCFTVDLSLTYDSLEEYNKEKERIEKIHSDESSKNECIYLCADSFEYFVISPDEYRLQLYLDDETRDGFDFRIETVIFNDAQQSARYISSLQWDGQKKEQRVMEVVETIVANTNTRDGL